MLTEHESVRPLQLRRLGNAGDMAQVIARPALFAQHMHHVQAPAVHAPWRFQPVAHDTIFPAIDFIDQRRRPVVQLRQAGVSQPVVGNALGGKIIPVAPRRIGVMAGAAATALVAVEPGMRIAAMVEHAIEDQTHSLFLRMVAQAQQRRIAAKLRINATIILGIIFMHAGGDKYRIQVQRRYAKLLQVRQPLADTIEIAAVKGGAARLGG